MNSKPANIGLHWTAPCGLAAEAGSLGALKAVAAAFFMLSVAIASSRAAEKPVSWRFASWGMSKEEVAKASRGSAREALPSDQPSERARDAEVLLKGATAWEGQSFTAFYGFGRKTHRLESITLQLEARDQASADSLKADLIHLYGPPESAAQHPDVEVLSWTAGNEAVCYMRLRDPETAVGAPVTSVNFQPLEVPR